MPFGYEEEPYMGLNPLPECVAELGGGGKCLLLPGCDYCFSVLGFSTTLPRNEGLVVLSTDSNTFTPRYGFETNDTKTYTLPRPTGERICGRTQVRIAEQRGRLSPQGLKSETVERGANPRQGWGEGVNISFIPEEGLL